MIELTRFNNQKVVINAEMIEFVEATPDTSIHMNNGKTHIVKEAISDVIEKVIRYRQEVNRTIVM